jgi:hypothetical protein
MRGKSFGDIQLRNEGIFVNGFGGLRSRLIPARPPVHVRCQSAP